MSKLTEKEIRNIRAEALIVAEDHEHRERKYHSDMTADGCIRVPARVLVSLCDAVLSSAVDGHQVDAVTDWSDGSEDRPIKVGDYVKILSKGIYAGRIGKIVKYLPGALEPWLVAVGEYTAYWQKVDLELVTRCVYRFGDRVRVHRKNHKHNGKIGVVTSAKSNDSYWVDIEGSTSEECCFCSAEDLAFVDSKKLSEDVTVKKGARDVHVEWDGKVTLGPKAEEKEFPFKVGDKVVTTGHRRCVGEVISVAPECVYPIRVKFPALKKSFFYKPGQLEHSKEPEEKPTIELGDKVRVRADSVYKTQRAHGTGTVTEIHSGTKFPIKVSFSNGKRLGFRSQDLELV